jgi:hypothetical protein
MILLVEPRETASLVLLVWRLRQYHASSPAPRQRDLMDHELRLDAGVGLSVTRTVEDVEDHIQRQW